MAKLEQSVEQVPRRQGKALRRAGARMSDDDSDDKQAEVDAEIARKCSLVMQPLIKKFKRHSKKLAALEEEIEKQRQATDTGFPAQGAELAAMRSELEQAIERLHRDIGERVRHEDHARVEVGVLVGHELGEEVGFSHIEND